MNGPRFFCWFFATTLALVAIYGVYLRTAHLGRPAFSEDEYLHVYAARGLIETGQPVLPGGRLYSRALPYSYLVSFSHRLFGESEVSSRVVSVFFDLLSIAFVFFLAAKYVHRTVGWLSFALLAGSSFSIAMARYTRMYTLHQLLYVIIFLLTYLALEKDAQADESDPSQSRRLKWRAWGILVLAGFSALLNYEIHALSVFFALGFFAYCIFEAALRWKKRGFRLAAKSMPAVIVYSISLALLIAAAVPGIREKLVQELFWLPDWAKSDARNYSFYRWFFMEQYANLILFIFPGAVYFYRARSKFGLYAIVSFLIPFLALSLIPLKSERYIFNILPFFVIWMAAGIYYVASFLAERTLSAGAIIRDLRGAEDFGPFLAMALGGVLIGFSPSLAAARKIHHMEWGNWMGVRYLAWREVQSALGGKTPADPIISSRPSPMLYYCGRADYSLNRLGIVEMEKDMSRAPKPGKITDSTTGALFLQNLSELSDVLRQNKRIWLVIEKSLLDARKKRLSPEEIQFIQQQFKLVLTTQDGSLVILRREAA